MSLSTEAITTYAAAGSGIGALVVVCGTVLCYARRLCQNRDAVSECRIGKTVVRIAVDTNGDGQVAASEKIVFDVNTRKVFVEKTGTESPGQVTECPENPK